MASEKWLEDVGEQLRKYVEHVCSSPYADRVIGFHVCSGVSAEWQSWGLWSDQRGDFSEPFVTAFRQWLKEKYSTDEVLQKAWHDDDVTFETAPVPSFEERSAKDENNTLLRSPEELQRFIDFYSFYPLVTARAIKHFSRIVKEASKGRALVVVFYGYPIQYGGIANESQHLALADILRCEDVDILSSPAMYSKREPGGTSTTMLPLGSLNLHGKMFFDEADLRTHLSDPKAAPGRASNELESVGIMKREFGMDMAYGNACWWFDMAGGWFSGELAKLIGQMKPYYEGVNNQDEKCRRIQDAMRPEMAVFMDEKSFHRFTPMTDFTNYSITFLTPELPRVGVSYDHYLLSDIEAVPERKVYLFQNAYDLTDAERETINSLKRDGKLLIFMYGAGSGRYGDAGSVEVDRNMTSELVGMEIAWSDEKAKMILTPSFDSFTALCNCEEFGIEEEASPVLSCIDPDAEQLAFYNDGRCGLAIKKHENWTSVWCGVPSLPIPFIREVCKDAGVHVYSESDDAFYAGRGYVTLHAKESGEKTIALPGKYSVEEILGGDFIADETDTLTFQLKQFETKCFRIR